MSSSAQPPPGSSLTPSIYFDLPPCAPKKNYGDFCFNCFKKHFVQLYPSLIRARSGSSMYPLAPSLRVGNERYMMRLLTLKSIKLFVVLIPSRALPAINYA